MEGFDSLTQEVVPSFLEKKWEMSARDGGRQSVVRREENEVVLVDDLSGALVALAGKPRSVDRRELHEPASELGPRGIDQRDAVSRVKAPANAGHADRED